VKIYAKTYSYSWDEDYTENEHLFQLKAFVDTLNDFQDTDIEGYTVFKDFIFHNINFSKIL